jgi:hypothetical protein
MRHGSSLSPILFNITINNICNGIREKIKATDLKPFIYADNTMICGNKVKELKTRSAHWETESKR